jgi:hypothetical protein
LQGRKIKPSRHTFKTAKNTLQWQARRAEKIAVPPLRHFYWTEAKKFLPIENCDNDTGMFFLLQKKKLTIEVE